MTTDLTTTSILSLFETTKEQRASFVSDIVSKIENGDVSPLKIHLQVKSIEDLLNMLTNTSKDKNKGAYLLAQKYKDSLLVESQKHGKNFELFNGKFEIKEVGTKYDYSVCSDSIWDDLNKQKEELDIKMKEREKFLQNIPATGIVNQETGEMIYRAAKSSTTSVAVKLK